MGSGIVLHGVQLYINRNCLSSKTHIYLEENDLKYIHSNRSCTHTHKLHLAEYFQESSPEQIRIQEQDTILPDKTQRSKDTYCSIHGNFI